MSLNKHNLFESVRFCSTHNSQSENSIQTEVCLCVCVKAFAKRKPCNFEGEKAIEIAQSQNEYSKQKIMIVESTTTTTIAINELQTTKEM